MQNTHGQLIATGMQIALIASRVNDVITERLISGAIDELVRHGVDTADITTYKVPGAFEIPGVARRVQGSGNFDAVCCLGAVIRGETPHFDYVAAEVTKGIAALTMTDDAPVTFGIITADTLDQAIDRSGGKSGNKGTEAARAAIELVNLYRQI